MQGGPFANIAHGCNSVVTTKLAMHKSDYTVTEAGFDADLGAEKFFDIKCRMNGLLPNVIMLVATIRALKHHGGMFKGTYGEPNVDALRKGMSNLLSHIHNVKDVWQTHVAVALNRFAIDSDEKFELFASMLQEVGVKVAPCNGWAEGGNGMMELAQLVCDIADQNPVAELHFTHPDEASLIDKNTTVAQKFNHAKDVSFAPQAVKDLTALEKEGYTSCPVCITKTQYSMSDKASLLGAPDGYTLTIRSACLSACVGFVVAFAGSIIAMPGLLKVPAAMNIDVDDNGEFVRLF